MSLEKIFGFTTGIISSLLISGFLIHTPKTKNNNEYHKLTYRDFYE